MSDENDLLSPESSPNELRKAGVRRVNNLPLMIGLTGLVVFVMMIALVAVKRANQQAKPLVKKDTRTQSKDHFMLAKEVIGERAGGIIPPANPIKAVTQSLVLPVAVVDKPDELPLPSTLPTDSELERIRQTKMQLFEEAVRAKTTVEISQVTKPHPIDNRSIEDAKSNYNPQATNQPLGGIEEEQRWVLHSKVEKPKTPYVLRAGSIIPGVMISGIRSDLPGQIRGQVSQNVYDTATGNHLLIPQGTQLLGLYSADVSYGQNSILIAWQRLTFPDGKALDIGSMPGNDSAGLAGFRDQVNNHYVRVFGSALLMSGIVAGITYSQNQTVNGPFTSPTAGSVLSQALGQQLGEVTAQMVAKNLNIAPDLTIRSGYRFNVIAVKDLSFKKPYQAFDYR